MDQKAPHQAQAKGLIPVGDYPENIKVFLAKLVTLGHSMRSPVAGVGPLLLFPNSRGDGIACIGVCNNCQKLMGLQSTLEPCRGSRS